MTDNHPHKTIIKNMNDIGSLVSLIQNSKIAYIKKNLSIHLHSHELALLHDIQKHTKPHHKRIRIRKYQKLLENPESIPENFEVHRKIFIRRYKKLEKKGIITLDLEPEDDLPYDMEFTEKGLDVLKEIKQLENEWEKLVLKDCTNKKELTSLLQEVSLNALTINYGIQKESKNIF